MPNAKTSIHQGANKRRTKGQPPPGPGSTALTRREIRSVQRIYTSVPAEDIMEALEHSSDARMLRLADIMRDPAYDKHSFALKCRNAQLNPADVWQAVIQLHRLDGELRVARRLPQMLESIADEAIPQVAKCGAPGCKDGLVTKTGKGGGEPVTTDCPKCDGLGQILVKADNDARKLALEVTGLIGQRGPLVDARQVHLSQTNVQLPDLSEWSRATDDIFEERGSPRRSPPPSPPGAVPTFEEAEVVGVAP